MKITPIASETNKLVKQIRALNIRHHREKAGFFLVEGAKLVAHAFAAGISIKDVLISASFLKSGLAELHAEGLTAVSMIDDRLFSELATTESPCGVLAVARAPDWQVDDLFKETVPLIVIADAIQDPGNLGTMIRTALAARCSGMILTKGAVDRFNPKVVRSAAGALFGLPIVAEFTAEQAIECARGHSLQVIACQPGACKPYWEVDMTVPTALLFGNEGQGFSQSTASAADQVVSIPMNEKSESLNVAVSSSIILFEAGKQRLQTFR